MGCLLQAQGRLAEAEKFFKRTLRGGIGIQKVAQKKSQTFSSLDNLKQIDNFQKKQNSLHILSISIMSYLYTLVPTGPPGSHLRVLHRS